MEQTILSISGKPGLYKLVSRGKTNLIVEKVDETHKRLPVFASDSVTSLNDIAIYTESEDIPLTKVLANLYKKEEGKQTSLNYKKCDTKGNAATVSVQWYDILVNNGITDFTDPADNSEGNNEQEG